MARRVEPEVVLLDPGRRGHLTRVDELDGLGKQVETHHDDVAVPAEGSSRRAGLDDRVVVRRRRTCRSPRDAGQAVPRRSRGPRLASSPSLGASTMMMPVFGHDLTEARAFARGARRVVGPGLHDDRGAVAHQIGQVCQRPSAAGLTRRLHAHEERSPTRCVEVERRRPARLEPRPPRSHRRRRRSWWPRRREHRRRRRVASAHHRAHWAATSSWSGHRCRGRGRASGRRHAATRR